MQEYLKSPINYTGIKFNLLNQILPYFPNKISKFIEPFGGSCSFIQNIEADSYYFSDIQPQVISFFKYIYNKHSDDILNEIYSIIEKYKLTRVNLDGFLDLRNDYNKDNKDILFYCLMAYSFNFQIRFNKLGEFNMPFGNNRSRFNASLEQRLIEFMNKINNLNIEFETHSFEHIDTSNFDKNTFVYCDPPYDTASSIAVYNEKIWSTKNEVDLYNWLDKLNDKNIKFTLSNVELHKGISNNLLIEWSKKYNKIQLNKSYHRCNYQIKNRLFETKEVLITNY